MAEAAFSTAASTAAGYYNSHDADRFYAEIWGGEDIHIGLYNSETEPIAAASRRTVEALASLIQAPQMGDADKERCIVDLGSGYGGAARQLCKNSKVKVEAINVSSVENARHRDLNLAAGLDQQIHVHNASFEAVPLGDESADVVWSQDAILHSGDRQQVMKEAARLLKPGGVMVMTDPMASDGVPSASLSAILERIHLTDLGSPARYKSWANNVGLHREIWDDRTPMLIRHYSRVRDELKQRHDELKQSISSEYLTKMNEGLKHWIEGGYSGRLCWGLMRYRKLEK